MNGHAQLLACGNQAEVYILEDGGILKLYTAANQNLAQGENHWLESMRVLGFPTPRPVGLIRVNGRMGLRMENVPGACREDALWVEAGAGHELGREIGRLHARLHNLAAAPVIRERFPNCPMATAIFEARLQQLGSEPVLEELRELLADYGERETACHGDFHAANILATPNGSIVLDWADSYLGPAESDIATTIVRARAVNLDPEATPEEVRRFRDNLEFMLSDYLSTYGDARALERTAVSVWVRLVAAQTLARNGGNHAILRAYMNGEFQLPWPAAGEEKQH